jgi:membrane protease YdiL (CAAX protease family)
MLVDARLRPHMNGDSIEKWVARHDSAAFLLVTFGIAWPLWFASGALGRTPVRAPDLSWFVAQLGVFAPALAGMVVAGCVEPRSRRGALRTLAAVYLPASLLGLWVATRGHESFTGIGSRETVAIAALGAWILAWFGSRANRLVTWPGRAAQRHQTLLWVVASLVAPALVFALAWSQTGAGDGPSTFPAMPVRALTPAGLVAAFAVNLAYGGSLGEEPGWRGAWLPQLLRHRSPVAASTVIGFWWALWHAPIDLSQGFGLPGLGALVVRQASTWPVAVLFTWVTLRAGGSLLPPLVLHTAINAIPDFALVEPARYERAMAVFILLLTIAAFAVVLGDPRFRQRVPDAAAPGEAR